MHIVEVESVHALSCFLRSLGGLDQRRIAVCWSGVCEDQEQRVVCVVIVKVEVGWDVGGALGAKSEKG